jgi:hypothetical protein
MEFLILTQAGKMARRKVCALLVQRVREGSFRFAPDFDYDSILCCHFTRDTMLDSS